LGREPSRFGIINWGELYRRAAKLLEDLHLPINPRTLVGNLGIGQQQLVEIAKALSQNARILVLDEPTAALTESEVETLFEILKNLKSRGVGMIYISHKLDEVFRMSDLVTVLRDGKTVGTESAENLTKEKVISLMVGREVGDIFPKSEHERGAIALEVRNLTAADTEHVGQNVLENINFSVRKGEVLGIAGLMGAGRSELLMSLFGAHRGKVSGEIYVEAGELQ
jgi:D-xylose transport system ATP-binding protein